MNVETIKFAHEEDGLWIVLELDEAIPAEGVDMDTIRVRVQDVAEQLYDSVRATIGPWLRERDEAEREYLQNARVFACDPDESGGYDVSDPKHPAFHSTHADIWDMREGK